MTIEELIKGLENMNQIITNKYTVAQSKLEEYIEHYDNSNFDLEQNQEYLSLSDEFETFGRQVAEILEILEEVKIKAQGPYEIEDFEEYFNFLNNIKEPQPLSPLQQRETALSSLEEEAIRDTAELKEFESKEGQNIGKD